MSIIQVNNLTKQFRQHNIFSKNKITAVDNLNLKINKGEIFAFLGPNGAGKTTTIKMLTGFLMPTGGEIKLFDRKFSYRDIYTKRNIGYLSESPHLPDYYRVYELLDFYCEIFDMHKQNEITEKILEEVGILAQRKEWIKNLSMGQKRCLGLAVALINKPQVLFLDEPTVYLDPIIVDKVRRLLLRLKSEGTTIFMSSHILSEAEKISDRFAIIKNGRLLEEGSTAVLTKYSSLEQEFLNKVKTDG
jgi:ABC-2 type transport system ATP-binding protein